MNSSSVSVVIPTYNSASLVVEAIESVFAQTRLPDEIIVVDDGSTDDTSTRVAKFGDRVRYVFQKNAGASAARNRGVELTQGEFVAFLDADDVWHPRKLEVQMDILERRPELGLLGGQSFTWPAAFPVLCDDPEPHYVPVTRERLLIKNYIPTPTIIVRRDVLERVGGFDTSLKSTEDRDFWIRIAEAVPIACVDLPLAGVRNVETSLSRQVADVPTNMLAVLRKVDKRKAWKGRWLLRRKAYGYTYLSCAYIYQNSGSYGLAIINLFQSIVWYPLPFRRDEVRTWWVRPKTLVVIILRSIGWKAPE